MYYTYTLNYQFIIHVLTKSKPFSSVFSFSFSFFIFSHSLTTFSYFHFIPTEWDEFKLNSQYGFYIKTTFISRTFINMGFRTKGFSQNIAHYDQNICMILYLNINYMNPLSPVWVALTCFGVVCGHRSLCKPPHWLMVHRLTLKRHPRVLFFL